MYTLNSDSEVEEIAPQPAPRPRAVRRPVPVRTASSGAPGPGGSGAAAGSSDDSDDDDFFRWRRRPPAPPAAESVGGAAESLGASVVREEAAAPPSVECLSDACSTGSAGAAAEDTGLHAKRKSPDSDSESEPEVQLPRSRSVSLTPPPFQRPPADAHSAQSGLEEGIYVGDSDSEQSAERVQPRARRHITDISSLDPALQAVLMSGEAGERAGGSAPMARPEFGDGLQARGSLSPAPARTRAGGVLEKVQVEFQFAFDDEFLNTELPRFWEAKRWRRIKIHERAKVTKKLNEHIAVIVFMSDTMDKALRAYSATFVLDVLAMDPVLMNRTMRVFPMSTMASLGDKLAHYITVFPRSVYNRVREREALERAREMEQSRRHLEAVRQLEQVAAAPGSPGGGGDEPYGDGAGAGDGDAALEAASGIRIKIRDKAGKDVLLRVAATTSVAAIIENYCKLRGLASGTLVKLEFDDEALDPGAAIGDTDVEDDDMLTAFF